jgi:hypothetical protein
MRSNLILPVFQPLEVGESFNGYLLRRAQLNAYSSLHDVTNVIGVRSSYKNLSVVQGRFQDLCKLLELDISKSIEHFFWLTGDRSRESAWLFGKVPLGIGLVDIKRPKVCPECLEECEVIPAEWELTFYTVCPRHRRPMIDVCAHCESRIGWGRKFIRRCKSCGRNFSPSTESATEEEAHLTWLMGEKLHAHSRQLGPDLEEELLSSLSLNGLTELAVFAGGLLGRVPRIDVTRIAILPLAKRRKIMELASSVMNEEWPHGVRRLVDEFLSAEPHACRTGRELLPGLYGPLMWRHHREGFPILLSAISEHISGRYPNLFAPWDGQCALVREAPASVALETISSFCKRLRISRITFHRAASSLEGFRDLSWSDRKSRRRLTRDESAALEKALREPRKPRETPRLSIGDDAISLDEFQNGDNFPFREMKLAEGSRVSISVVARRLGISAASAMSVIEHVGALRSKSQSSSSQSKNEVCLSRYVEFEVHLSRKLVGFPSSKGSQHGVGIARAVRHQLRRYDMSIGAFIGRILGGEAEIVGIDLNEQGLDRLLVSQADISELAGKLRSTQTGSTLDAEGVARLLRLPRVSIVFQLRKEGYIQGYQKGSKGGGRTFFSRSNIEGFRQQYVTLSEMMTFCKAGASSKSHGHIRKRLADAGVEPAFRLSRRGYSTPFYDRETSERVLAPK